MIFALLCEAVCTVLSPPEMCTPAAHPVVEITQPCQGDGRGWRRCGVQDGMGNIGYLPAVCVLQWGRFSRLQRSGRVAIPARTCQCERESLPAGLFSLETQHSKRDVQTGRIDKGGRQ